MEEIRTDASINAGIYGKLARIVSLLMHPFIMPLYAVCFMMFGDSLLSVAPARLKFFFISVVVLNACIVPAVFIGLLRATGILSDLSLNKRQDRTIPLAIVTLCYGICIYMVSDIFFAFLIRKYLFAAFGCSLLALVVNFFWKISLHMIAAGAITAMLLLFGLAGMGSVFFPLLLVVLMSGILASARLYLGMHSPLQIAIGYFAGILVASTALMVF